MPELPHLTGRLLEVVYLMYWGKGVSYIIIIRTQRLVCASQDGLCVEFDLGVDVYLRTEIAIG